MPTPGGFFLADGQLATARVRAPSGGAFRGFANSRLSWREPLRSELDQGQHFRQRDQTFGFEVLGSAELLADILTIEQRLQALADSLRELQAHQLVGKIYLKYDALRHFRLLLRF